MASQQTQIVRKIIANIERTLKAVGITSECQDVMIGCIIDEAQELVNEQGYRFDVAVAKATKTYRLTAHIGKLDYYS